MILPTLIMAILPTVRVNVLVGPQGPSIPETRRAMIAVKKEYRRKGIRLHVRRYISSDLYIPADTSQASREKQLRRWKAECRKQKVSRTQEICLAVTGPLEEGEDVFLGGLTSQICSIGRTAGTAVVNMTLTRHRVEDTRAHFETDLGHEIAHAAGMYHFDDGQMCDSNALFYVQDKILRLTFFPTWDIKECVLWARETQHLDPYL